jgi:hypothetical protein
MLILCFGTLPNAKKKRVLISGRPLIDQDNNVVAAVVTIKDISKYKQLEEELKKKPNHRQLIGFRKQRIKEETKEEGKKEKESKLGDTVQFFTISTRLLTFSNHSSL